MKTSSNKILKVAVLGSFITVIFLITAYYAKAATNISSTAGAHWAWNDAIGWIDFYTQGNSNITVSSQKLTGYASSSAGDISLDCATTRIGDICASTSNYGVTNDGSGNLSGWAWNDTYGWISFYCGNISGGCGTSSYRVLIDSSGNFSNYAWNDILGWISFNCSNTGGCLTSDYKVVTSWTATSTSGLLDSSTYDTGISGGAQINSVLWHGTLPSPANGAYVGFQFAVSNSSSGPWTYKGYDGTSNTWYIADPGTAKAVDYVLHNNARYFRYRIQLVSNQTQSASPRVDDININWSR